MFHCTIILGGRRNTSFYPSFPVECQESATKNLPCWNWNLRCGSSSALSWQATSHKILQSLEGKKPLHGDKITKDQHAPLTTEKQACPTSLLVPLRGIITFPHEVHAAKGALANALKEPQGEPPSLLKSKQICRCFFDYSRTLFKTSFSEHLWAKMLEIRFSNSLG